MTTILVAIVVCLITVFIAWAWSTAQRLNRLHIRTDSALQALQAALDQRSAVLAALYPQHNALVQSAQKIQLDYETFSERSEKEKRVGACISLLGDAVPASLVEAEARVQLAFRFYNDAVADTRALRVCPLVRGLRLGGTARLPIFFELPNTHD